MGIRIMEITPYGLVRVRIQKQGNLVNITAEKMIVTHESDIRGNRQIEFENIQGENISKEFFIQLKDLSKYEPISPEQVKSFQS